MCKEDIPHLLTQHRGMVRVIIGSTVAHDDEYCELFLMGNVDAAVAGRFVWTVAWRCIPVVRL